MKLMTEVLEEGIDFIVEKKEDGSKGHYISGIFMQSNIKNRNGRIYPRHVLENQVNAYQVKIKQKKSLSELNHPNGPQINLDRVSHLVTELSFDGDNVIGKAKVLDTPCGRIVKNLIDEGVGFGVSSRGMGSIKCNSQGINEVQDDFHLAAIDVVSDPSGPDCWVNGIMESVDWVFDEKAGWQAIKLAEETQNHIKNMSSRELQEKKLKLFERYITKLSKI